MHIIGGAVAGLSTVQDLLPVYLKTTGVLTGVETTINNYTVPASKTFHLQSVIASGSADGEFKLYINGVQKLYGRTSSSERESQRVFGGAVGIKCVAGDAIVLKVTHYETTTQEFESTLAGFLNVV